MMSVEKNSEEAGIIRQLIPLSRMTKTKFAQLCTKISVEQAQAGTVLFSRGNTENYLFFLLEGQISLQTDEFKVETIQSGTNAARFAVAHQIPRKINAIAESNIRFLRLNAEMIDFLQTDSKEEESSFMTIDEPEDNADDWMTTLLKSPIFRALPPANLQRIIMALEAVSFKKDELIIKQGEPGDYYYLIKSGRCLVTRKASPTAKAINLGQLKDQDTFGEDSLLSGEPRNVSIIALNDISLLRLSKKNFIELIKIPSLKYIDYSLIESEVSRGAMLMDVRPPDEYQQSHLENSINIPFFSLRMHLKTLNKKQPVIVICQNEKTSKAAAFMLLRNKIKALILKGGLENIPDVEGADKASLNIVDGIEASHIKILIDNNKKPRVLGQSPADEKAEIDQLKETIVLLEEKCKKLMAEKEESNIKYNRLLSKTIKLQNSLDLIKNQTRR